ncbi:MULTISPECIES: xanthine dehydrogenase accessory protein XdhC [Comamonas]|uniref:xanthine dehydrogenase accessory protein XdhC n=1 Tax=Comamonas TaxID=283 RepID=UPI0035E3EF15
MRCGVNDGERLRAWAAQAPVCLVEVEAVQGSAPRSAGAWMALQGTALVGTIGGGHLEWEAMRMARSWLQQGMPGDTYTQRMALGPSLGQCCGGAVQVRWSAVHAHNVEAVLARLQPARAPVALFGAGHVGHALVRVLQPLPFLVHWVDSRDDVFPAQPMAQLHCEHSSPVHHAVRDLPAQSLVLVMSFSHAEDLDIVSACLLRQRERGDLPFIGLIGSATKWAVFQKRLAERGFGADEIAHITCPIGLPGIAGKEPEVIAIAVAAQLLQLRAQQLAAA